MGVAYPDLYFSVRSELVVVTGWFPLINGTQVLDRYQVEIELPRNFPTGVPVVREVGGRIPRCPERHVEQNGAACLFLPDERWWVWPTGSTLRHFLDGPVRAFFVGQSLVEHGEPWPQGERRHGADGIIDYYSELLATTDESLILRYLDTLRRPIVKGHHLCPCGGGARLRDCHREQVANLRAMIPRQVAQKSWDRVRKFLAGRTE